MTAELAAMRTRYEQVRQKEEDAYEQVKHAVEMVEHAQLEQTQVSTAPDNQCLTTPNSRLDVYV